MSMYIIHRGVSFKEKNNIMAVYYNENLYFFKNTTVKWMEKILKNQFKDIPLKFLEYLCCEGIIEESKKIIKED